MVCTPIYFAIFVPTKKARNLRGFGAEAGTDAANFRRGRQKFAGKRVFPINSANAPRPIPSRHSRLRAKERMKLRLQTKTTLTIALLVVLVLTASSYLFYDTAKRTLDAEMGKRLVAVAKTSAAQLNGSYLRALQPGG